ncbi:hypothetical protein B0J14DRAFT_588832 [Halenospora varia]|nr:hypothetical protein B0J14DRAFT_588832 [Halenospora varia]
MWTPNIPSFRDLLKLSSIAALVASASASPLQYCRVNEALRTDQCLGISTFKNWTSNANDFYLLISAKFDNRKGFAAFGTGTTMDGALMFIMYPGEHEGDVTVSVRTTNYHYPPEPSDLTPEYKVLKTWVDGSYHNAQLVCYSCDDWTRNAAQVTSKNQGWIFANHYDYMMQSNDLAKPISQHTDYDRFELDMTISHYPKGTPIAPDLVDNGRKSVGAQKSSSWSPQQLFAIHGLLLAFAFVIMMPLGIAGIRSGYQKAFKIHWMIQMCSVSIALMGIVLGIYLTWGHSIKITTLNGTHKFFGFWILLCLGLTPTFGYLHHVRYLKLGRATGITIWHRRLGASILAGGWVNVLVGLKIAGQSIWYFIGAFVLMAISSTVIYSAPKLKKVIDTKRGKSVRFVIGEDEESEEELLPEDRKIEQR